MSGRSMIQQLRARKHKWGRKSTIWRDKCYVYFIRADVGSRSLVKIGHTTVDVQKRLHALQLGSPVELALIGFVEVERKVEADLHCKFQHLRSHREWFELTADLAREISIIIDTTQ